MEILNFPTQAAYIIWRSERRAEYAALSIEIRQTKLRIRSTMMAGDYAGQMQTDLLGLRARASEMMEQRKEAKAAAAAAWQARRSEKLAAD